MKRMKSIPIKKKRSSNKYRWFVPLKRKKINDVKKRNKGADTNIFDPGLNPSVQKEQRNQRKKWKESKESDNVPERNPT
jgi:hypothetical protein